MRIRVPLVVAFVALAAAVIVPSNAFADAISDKRAEAARIADHLDALDVKVESLAEEYDQAQVQLRDLNAQVKTTQDELAKNQSASDSVRSRMTDWAIRSYVEDSATDPMLTMLEPSQTLEQAAGVEGYTDAALGRDDQLTGELHQRGEDTFLLQQRLNGQLARQKDLVAAVNAKQKASQAAEADARTQLAAAQHDLGDLLVQEQQRRDRAQEISAQEAAKVVSRSVNHGATADPAAAGGGGPTGAGSGRSGAGAGGGGGASPAGRVIPPPSPGASGAVSAARSQMGVAYHWGEMSPGNGFDCSGLTAWAWGQAGHSLPHSAEAQYGVTTHVSVADIQPGDLVFFGSPIHHVGMYVGNGQMIDAPHTGAVVRIAPAFRRDLVGVGRP
ncbi:MAG: hypothetical protein JWL70_1343 [Acidimicrobiia bacterium]|nr:hypothetical protein [Acidimicrobiia bacterium]